MDLKEKIQSLDIKTVALRKAAEEHEKELEDIKKQIDHPAPTVRRELKTGRVINFEKDFISNKWGRKPKKHAHG